MSVILKVRSAAALALAAACADTSAPEQQSMLNDPAAIKASLDVVNSTFNTPQIQSVVALDRLAGLGDMASPTGSATEIVRSAMPTVVDGMRDAGVARNELQAVAFARALHHVSQLDNRTNGELFGTYRWDVERSAYTREGPDPRVALLGGGGGGTTTTIELYAIDPATGEPVEPLVLLGYLEISEGGGRTDLTLTGVDEITYLRLVIDIVPDGLEVDGFVSDGTTTLDVEFVYAEYETPGCADSGDCEGSTYELEIRFALNSPPVVLEMFWEQEVTEEGWEITKEFEWVQNGQLIFGETWEEWLLLEPNVFQTIFSSEIVVDGIFFAYIDGTGETYPYIAFLNADLQEMSDEEIGALVALTQTPAIVGGWLGEILTTIFTILGPLAEEVLPPIVTP